MRVFITQESERHDHDCECGDCNTQGRSYSASIYDITDYDGDLRDFDSLQDHVNTLECIERFYRSSAKDAYDAAIAKIFTENWLLYGPDVIALGVYGIVIAIGHEDADGGRSGSLTSDLHEGWEDNSPDSYNDEDRANIDTYNATIDGIEAMILACACAGVDVTTPAFLEAIETAVEGAANNAA